jgi:predicted RNA-binding protein YlqC (UPF0109 family)
VEEGSSSDSGSPREAASPSEAGSRREEGSSSDSGSPRETASPSEAGSREEGVKELLEYLAREIVDDPDAVSVTESSNDRGVLLTLRVAQDDMGKVIGRGGRTARALRTVIKAAALRAGIHHTHVEIAD